MKDERGALGGIEAGVFGALVLLGGSLLVAGAWGAVDAKASVAAATREATRAYVEAPSPPEAAAHAERAADHALRGFGRSPAAFDLRVTAGGFARCERVTLEGSYRVPVVRVPFLPRRPAQLTVRARHSEVVDPYRSGLAGTARCP